MLSNPSGKAKRLKISDKYDRKRLLTAASFLIFYLSLPVHYDKIVIGGIVPLLPGIALTTSIRDLFNGDYLSGAIHLLDALLTAMCIAVGVGFIIVIYRHFSGGELIL